MPQLFRGCSALVIRCFKRVEHFADWLTGAAGPVFVFLCWSLIILGGFAFFEVAVRQLSWAAAILLSPILSLVPLNLYGQYYLVTHVPPGFPSPRALAKSPKPLPTDVDAHWLFPERRNAWAAEQWGFHKRGGRTLNRNGFQEVQAAGKRVRRCRKCDGPKPERSHHCSVCRRCVLLMDHHCPWINACVGLHNQRHFVLFMAYLSIACWVVSALGWRSFWDSFNLGTTWTSYTPRLGYTLLYVLSIAIGIAVPVLMSWHIYMVVKGETSIESHDNAYLESRALAEGMIYLNPYDMGRRQNLEQFFNIGESGFSRWSLLLPLSIPPASNGWTWDRRVVPVDDGLKPVVDLHAPDLAVGLVASPILEGGLAGRQRADGKRYVLGDEEGLTDDEEGGGGWLD